MVDLKHFSFHFSIRSHFPVMTHYILGIVGVLLAKKAAVPMGSHLSLLQRILARGYLSQPPTTNSLNLLTSFHWRAFSGWPLTKSRCKRLSASQKSFFSFLSFYFISSHKCFHCSCFLHCMRARKVEAAQQLVGLLAVALKLLTQLLAIDLIVPWGGWVT